MIDLFNNILRTPRLEGMETKSKSLYAFIYFIQRDMIDLKKEMTEEDIFNISKVQWNKFVISLIKDLALEYPIEENSTKSKTKHIIFETLDMKDYLVQNINTAI